MRSFAKKSQNFQNALIRKAADYSEQRQVGPNRVEFDCILKKLDDLFAILESLLKNQRTQWLLSESFTILDICFGILLYRLDMIGLEKKLWGQKPFISQYFQRIQQLESYQKSIPSQVCNVKTMWSKLPDEYKYVGYGLGLGGIVSLGLINIMK